MAKSQFQEQVLVIFGQARKPMTAKQFVCKMMNWPDKTDVRPGVVGTYARLLKKQVESGVLFQPPDSETFTLKRV